MCVYFCSLIVWNCIFVVSIVWKVMGSLSLLCGDGLILVVILKMLCGKVNSFELLKGVDDVFCGGFLMMCLMMSLLLM